MGQVVQVSQPHTEGASVRLPDAGELAPQAATDAGAVRRVIYTGPGDVAH